MEKNGDHFGVDLETISGLGIISGAVHAGLKAKLKIHTLKTLSVVSSCK